MARIVVKGSYAEVDLTVDDGVTATCVEHSHSDSRLAPPGNCDWNRQYDSWEHATRNAAHHADTGEQ